MKKVMLATIVISTVVSMTFAYLSFSMLYEGKIFPVVKDFEIDEISIESGVVRFNGKFRKVRPCEPQSVIAYVSYSGKVKTLREIRFTETDRMVTRSLGAQTFGDWLVTVDDYDTMELVSRHDCDGKTIFTDLVKVNLEDFK